MKVILAIDQSTSATKTLLFNENGALIDQDSINHNQIYPRPGWVEHDPEEIYNNLVYSLSNLFNANPIINLDIACLSITNQRETIVVFDKFSGKPLYNAIVWQCRRGTGICESLVSDGKNRIVQNKTGLPIDTYFSASKLKWLNDNRPDIKESLNNGQALIGTIDTYLIYRLTQGAVFATDHTNASRTLLFNIKDLCWDQELCEIFDVPIDALPEVRESSAQFGYTDLEGILSEPIVICGVMGDSQAALFAQKCYQPGNAKVTFGTGSSVLLNIGHSMKQSEKGIVTTIAWVLDGKPTYALEGITNYTGATIAWLQNQMELISDPSETETLAKLVKDNGGVYFVPAFVGLSAPYWKPDTKAAILGLTPYSTRAHIVRAALEAIAYRIRDVLFLMAEIADVDLKHIQADGGAVKNQFLMQFVADILGIAVHASSLPELSALGAVLNGVLGLKMYSSLDELRNIVSEFAEFHPVMRVDQVNDLVSGWVSAVNQVLHQKEG